MSGLNLSRARELESPVGARVFVTTGACGILLMAYLVLDPARGWAQPHTCFCPQSPSSPQASSCAIASMATSAYW